MSSRIPSSMDRFSDPLTPMNYDGPPTNAAILFKRLGVRGKPFSVKKKAVAEWLKENEPGWYLRDELEDEGYIDS